MDILPTVCNLAGVPVPSDRPIDGMDLSPILFNNAPGTRQCMVYFTQRFLGAVRCGDFKLHYMLKQNMYGIPVPQNPPVLFNVRYDPREATPLTPTNFPNYNQVVGMINGYKALFESNLVQGVPQFELYNTTVGAYQPCCDPTTTPPCYCPPASLTSELKRMSPQIEAHTKLMSEVLSEEMIAQYDFRSS